VKANAEATRDSESAARRERHAGGGGAAVVTGAPAFLRLQRQAGNAAVAGLLRRRPAAATGLLQRQVTTRIDVPNLVGAGSTVVDITQVKNLRIRYVIGRLKSMKARTAQQDEQLALAENYLEKREAALKSVDDWERGAPAQSPHFTGINKADVAKHLKVTLEEPHLIDQDQMNWCGPNTVLMVIARNDPAAYAHYVTETYTSGKGKLGAMDVKPGEGVKKGWTQAQIAQPADWIALGSLRDAGNWFLSATNTAAFGFATFPSDVKSWFAKYGVPDDKIVEKGGFVASVGAPELQEANALFSRGWNVLVWMHLFTVGWDNHTPQEITTFDIQHTHWVVMDGPFTPGADRWTCPVNTWGGKSRNTMEVLNSKISSSVFGYVAVDMNAQVRKPAPGKTPSPTTAGSGGGTPVAVGGTP